MQLKHVIVALTVLVALPAMVSAGTLVSGSQVEVNTNVKDLEGLGLLGTWRTTPYASDTITVQPGEIEQKSPSGEPVKLEEPINVEVPRPSFQAKFQTEDQVPLTKAEYVKWDLEGFWQTDYTSPKEDLCKREFKERLDREGRELLTPDTNVVVTWVGSGLVYCDAYTVLKDSQEGYATKINRDETYFEQELIVGDKGTLNMYNTQQGRQLSDRIPNVAYAKVLGGAEGLSEPLTDNQVYAYGNKKTNTNWEPFVDTQGVVQRIYDKRKPITDHDLGWDDALFFQDKVDEYNQAVNSVISQTNDVPQQWEGKADMSNVESISNNVIVPYEQSQEAEEIEIQMAFSGESFQLNIIGGEPRITSIQPSTTFQETQEGKVEYTVTNDASRGTASFERDVTCQNPNVQGDSGVVQVQAGESVTDEIQMNARPTELSDDTSTSCTVTVRGIDSDKTDTETFSATVEQKAACSPGEEVGPVTENDQKVIKVLNEDCSVRERYTCALDESFVPTTTGGYECQADEENVDPVEPTDPEDGGGDNDDENDFNVIITVINWMLGITAGVYAYTYTVAGVTALRTTGIYQSYPAVFDNATYVIPVIVALGVVLLLNAYSEIVIGRLVDMFTASL